MMDRWVGASLRGARALLIAATAQACGKPVLSGAPSNAETSTSPERGAVGARTPSRAAPPAPGLLSEPNAAGYRWGSVKIGGGGFVSGLIAPRDRAGAWFARTDVGGA